MLKKKVQNDPSFVETKEMTVGYRGVPLIRDIALRVHRGEILTLIGPNGSGKSTILKSLIRQLALIGGTVYLDGKSLQTLPERDLARTMSVLLTEHVRPELMTCWDVAAAGRYPYTDGWSAQRARTAPRWTRRWRLSARMNLPTAIFLHQRWTAAACAAGPRHLPGAGGYCAR